MDGPDAPHEPKSVHRICSQGCGQHMGKLDKSLIGQLLCDARYTQARIGPE